MDLSGFVGGPLEWTVFYSKPYTDHQARLRINATTGELIAVNSKDFALKTP